MNEIATRQGIRPTAEEESQKAALSTELNQIRVGIVGLLARQKPTPADQERLAKLRTDRLAVEDQLSKLSIAISRRQLASLPEVQAALAADAALVLWVDIISRSRGLDEHWGCVIRSGGEPHWERLPGNGPEGKWIDDDIRLAAKLKKALASGSTTAADVGILAKAFRQQRLTPLTVTWRE